MKNVTIALYDYDFSYVNGLLDYFRQMKGILYEVVGFTQEEPFLNYIKENHVEIIISGKEYDFDQLLGDNDAIVIILTEEPSLQESFNNKESMDKIKNYFMFKYQSAAKLINGLNDIYLKIHKPTVSVKGDNLESAMEIITFYSSYRSIELSYLSYALAKSMSNRKNILFISFESFETISLLTESQKSSSLSDLIYYLKQDNLNISMKLTTITKSIHGVNSIYGVEHDFDLYQLTSNDITRFLDDLRNSCKYDMLVCHADILNEGILTLFEKSRVIYTLKNQSVGEAYKMNHFYHLLSLEGKSEIKHKLAPIHIQNEYSIEENYNIKNMTEDGICEFMYQLVSEHMGEIDEER